MTSNNTSSWTRISLPIKITRTSLTIIMPSTTLQTFLWILTEPRASRTRGATLVKPSLPQIIRTKIFSRILKTKNNSKDSLRATYSKFKRKLIRIASRVLFSKVQSVMWLRINKTNRLSKQGLLRSKTKIRSSLMTMSMKRKQRRSQ